MSLTDALDAVGVLVSRDPATGAEVGRTPVSSTNDVHAAVARADAARAAWRALGAAQRAEILARAADAVESRADRIGDLVTAEMGKPLKAARGEARAAADGLREAHAWVDALAPRILREEGVVTEVVRDPLGVAAVITPWNFPLSMPEAMLTPALLAGNTVVWKPSELVPLTGAALHEAIASVLPPGVLELVQGGDDVGRALVGAGVQLVAFVGSQSAGRSIMQAAGRDLTRLVLELGGKDPMIVCDDADVERAADFAVVQSFRNAGQVCVSVERIYVHEAIAERFEQAVVRRAQSWRMGDGREDGVDMGPMVSEAQRAVVLQQLDDARRRGARVLLGGDVPDRPGWFLTPSVVADATEEMALMRDETFGPVAVIARVANDEEAIARANASPFGLGATVWSGDTARASALAHQLDAGMVGVNRSIGGASGAPWVGAKQSGYGFTGSEESLVHFTQTRCISRGE